MMRKGGMWQKSSLWNQFGRNYSARPHLALVNPATEAVTNGPEIDDETTIKSKRDKVSRGQPLWASSAVRRKEAFERYALLFDDASLVDEAATRLSLDMGRPKAQCAGEFKATKNRVRFFLDHVDQVLAGHISATSSEAVAERVEYEPLGVVAHISPWNYPWFVGSNAMVAALLTGNTVLYKPSEYAVRTGELMVEMLRRAGVGEEILQPVYGAGEVGAILSALPGLNGVYFTGSVATGKKVLAAAQNTSLSTRVQLELGGKDGFYVAADANVGAAAESLADGAMFNAGQSCCSVERIYVHASVYDEFVEKFGAAVKSMVMGDPMNKATYMGPLTRSSQRAFLDAQVKDALSKGGKNIVDPSWFSLPPKGFFYKPAVIVNANHTMSIMTEESFGPVVGIQKVGGDAEAIKLINDSQYGLTAGVYSSSLEHGSTLVKSLSAGTVYLNACDRVAPGTPWSGRRDSGIGCTLGLDGLRAFVQPKAYHIKK